MQLNIPGFLDPDEDALRGLGDIYSKSGTLLGKTPYSVKGASAPPPPPPLLLKGSPYAKWTPFVPRPEEPFLGPTPTPSNPSRLPVHVGSSTPAGVPGIFKSTLGNLVGGGLGSDIAKRLMNRIDPEINSPFEASMRTLAQTAAMMAGGYAYKDPRILAAMGLLDLGLVGLDYFYPTPLRSGSGDKYDYGSTDWKHYRIRDGRPVGDSEPFSLGTSSKYEFTDDDMLRLVAKTLGNLQGGWRNGYYDNKTIGDQLTSLASRMGREQQGHRAYSQEEIDLIFKKAAEDIRQNYPAQGDIYGKYKTRDSGGESKELPIPGFAPK